MAVVGEHRVEHRTVARRGFRGWSGRLVCSCGWTATVGPYRGWEPVSEDLDAQWEAHERISRGVLVAQPKAI